MEVMKKFVDYLKPNLGDAQIYTGTIGSVIGAHVGPGVIGFSYIEKE